MSRIGRQRASLALCSTRGKHPTAVEGLERRVCITSPTFAPYSVCRVTISPTQSTIRLAVTIERRRRRGGWQQHGHAAFVWAGKGSRLQARMGSPAPNKSYKSYLLNFLNSVTV